MDEILEQNAGLGADPDEWDDITPDGLEDDGAPEAEPEGTTGEAEPEQEEAPAETAQEEAPEQPAEQEPVFELKHLDEVRRVGRDEVVSLAQKGMDYDRVTGKNRDMEARIAEMERDLPALRESDSFLRTLAQRAGKPLDAFMDEARAAMVAQELGVDEATAMERVRLEKERKAFEAQKQGSEAARREQAGQAEKETWRSTCFSAFAQAYPDVDPKAIQQEVWDAFDGGETLVSAYARTREKSLTAELEQLRAEASAREQAAQNAARSTGSVQSAGKSETDEFDALWYDGN